MKFISATAILDLS